MLSSSLAERGDARNQKHTGANVNSALHSGKLQDAFDSTVGKADVTLQDNSGL